MENTLHSLPALHLFQSLPIAPECSSSSHSQVLNTLQLIERVEVPEISKWKRCRCFSLKVHWKSPQSQKQATDLRMIRHAWRTNDQVDHCFAEFLTLREAVYKRAISSHGTASCAFCASVLMFTGYALAQSRSLLPWFCSDDEFKNLISGFLNHMLKLILQLGTFQEWECIGQRDIPLLIKNFLMDEFD